MDPALFEKLQDIRRNLEWWRERLRAHEAGQVKITTNGVDTTNESLEMYRRVVTSNETILAKLDPDHLTALDLREGGKAAR